MTETIAGVDIPDTELAREATELVRKNNTPLLFDHSRRVFLFATLKGRYRGIEADPELLYVGAMFHDLGLTEHYRSTDQRSRSTAPTWRESFCSTTAAAPRRPAPCGWASRCTPPRASPTTWSRRRRSSASASRPTCWGSTSTRSRLRRSRPLWRRTRDPDFKNEILQAFYDGMKDPPTPPSEQ